MNRGFSLVEFLVALVILTLVGIALFNSIVYFIHRNLIDTLDFHMPDAAQNLVIYSDKLNNCGGGDACQAFDSDCPSSIYCKKNCTASDTCIVCYTNPDNGKKLYYSFNASLIKNTTTSKTYRVTLCWKYGGQNNTLIVPITITNSTGG